MIPTKIEYSIINNLANTDVKDYDKLIGKIKSYNLSYDLIPFIKTLEKYPYKFGTGNPKCCTEDINVVQNVSLELALCKIPSFYKIGYIGMNLCMVFEEISYHIKNKDKIDELFKYYWSYNPWEDKEIRSIEKACFNTASVSDICVPIFYCIWNNDFKLFNQYLPYALDAYNKLVDDGHRDHFLRKILDALTVISYDKRDVSKWISIFKKSFNWEKHDMKNYIKYKIILYNERSKNINLKASMITFEYIDALQQLIDLKLPYYLRVNYIDVLINVLAFFTPYFDEKRNELIKIRDTTPRFFIYQETKDEWEKNHNKESK